MTSRPWTLFLSHAFPLALDLVSFCWFNSEGMPVRRLSLPSPSLSLATACLLIGPQSSRHCGWELKTIQPRGREDKV